MQTPVLTAEPVDDHSADLVPENTGAVVPPARAPSGRFARGGGSGNPGGRPKQVKHVVELARRETVASIRALAEIRDNRENDPRARAAAAIALLDRAWGKPVEALAVDMTTGGAPLVQPSAVVVDFGQGPIQVPL